MAGKAEAACAPGTQKDAGRGTASPRRLVVPPRMLNACYRPYLCSPQRRQIFFGGAGSGKSVFLATRAVLDCMCGRNYLVLRQVARSLQHSCFAEIKKAIGRLGLQESFRVSLTGQRFDCLTSGAQILLQGLDDAEKIKSLTPARGVLTDIWVEEATQCSYADIKQMEKRLRGVSAHNKRLTMSFNPVSTGHWLYREYFGGWQEGQRVLETGDLLILRSDYRDNAFLSQEDCRALEGEQDAYYHRVYTLGEWGEQSGSILTRFAQADLSGAAVAPSALRYGLDFGFAADPAAWVKLHYEPENKRIAVLDGGYLRGLSDEGLARRLGPLLGGCAIHCDSAEPKAIAALRARGIRAMPARKGPDSLRAGLRFLQGHDIVADWRLREVLEEVCNYRWKEDPHGRALPKPAGEDHLMDAMRYALEADMLRLQAQVSSRR